jgi:hypothetical protein
MNRRSFLSLLGAGVAGLVLPMPDILIYEPKLLLATDIPKFGLDQIASFCLAEFEKHLKYPSAYVGEGKIFDTVPQNPFTKAEISISEWYEAPIAITQDKIKKDWLIQQVNALADRANADQCQHVFATGTWGHRYPRVAVATSPNAALTVSLEQRFKYEVLNISYIAGKI